MHNSTLVRKLFLIWGMSLLTLCSIGYLYYSHWQQQVNKSDMLPYILRSSALVLDMPAIGKQFKDFQKTAIGNSLHALPLCSQLHESCSWLHEVAGANLIAEDFPVVIAIQALNREAIGCLLYFDLRIPAVAKLVEHIVSSDVNKPYAGEARNYGGHTITAITWGASKSPTRLYVLKHSHYAIISLSELMIEDIIRGLVHKKSDTFLPFRKSAYKEGSLFINFRELPSLLHIFLNEDSYTEFVAQLPSILSQTQLEIKFTDHYLLFQGLISKEQPLYNDTHWLQNMPAGQSASLGLNAYIPISTAMLQHYVIHDPIKLLQAIEKHHASLAKPLQETDEQKNIAIATSMPCAGLQNDVALCTLGTAGSQQVLFVALHDVEDYINTLQETKGIQYDAAQQLPNFSAIYTVDAGIFANWLPQMMFPNFTPQFLSTADNYLILTDSFEALQVLEKSYVQGTTWAQKENTPPQLLGNISDTATYSMFIDMKIAHQWILNQLKPAWQLMLTKTIGGFLENGYLGLQLRPGDAQEKQEGYINAFLVQLPQAETSKTYQATASASDEEATTPENVFFRTAKPIQTRPIWVETHKQENSLVLIQDTDNQLYLIRPTGELLWKKQLDGQLIPDVLLVDIYKNKKWQYLCATATSLYLLDYTGNDVDIFPRQIITKGRATGVNLIDYDSDKNYRILITDERGNIYLKDTQYRPLPGWNPNPLKTSFVAPPLHVRVHKDYFIALQEVGVLHVMNRRGQPYAGFPINIGEPVYNPPIIQRAQQAANTYIVIVTARGTLKTYTLHGILKSSIELNQKHTTDKFTLLPSAMDGQEYAILQQSIDKFVVLNRDGEVVFEKPCEADQTVIGQYYHHGSYPLYVITKVEQGKTYIYDQKGSLIHPPLNNSGYPIELFWTVPSQQFTVYTTFGNQVFKYQVAIGNNNIVSEDLYE